MSGRALPRRRDAIERAALLGLVVMMNVAFSAKAVHIDDVYFIEVARQILQDPVRPFSGAAGLEDVDRRIFATQGRCPETFTSMSHPPLVPYVIAGITATMGSREVWLHLGFLPFALGAALSAHALARRFTQQAFAATLLLVSSPIFVLSAQSLMTDMPALALSLGAVALTLRGIDEERRPHLWLAGGLLGLAVLTRYSAATLLPLLLLYAWLKGRARTLVPVCVGTLLLVGAWSLQNGLVHGQLHMLASSRHYAAFYRGQSFDAAGLLKKLLGDLAGLGGTTPLALLLVYAASRRRRIFFACGVLAAALVFLIRPASIERLDSYRVYEIAAVALCVGTGTLLLSEACPAGSASSLDDRFLLAWLLLGSLGALILLPFGTARYVLPVLPPLVLLLTRRVQAARADVRRIVLVAFVGQGVLLSLALSLADSELAARYRAVARGVRESHPEKTIWYIGEWGFRYYMDRVGGRALSSVDESPAPGDIIVRPFGAGMHEMSPSVRSRSVRLQEIVLLARWPIRMMNFDAKAGYYSHHWGFLPWAVSRAPLERIEIFEVRVPAPALSPSPCASF